MALKLGWWSSLLWVCAVCSTIPRGAAFVSESTHRFRLLSPLFTAAPSDKEAVMNAQDHARRSKTDHASAVNDFCHFHGMLCHPKTAARCIQEFQGGTVLFMPSDYRRRCCSTADSLSAYDSSRILNQITYYALVLVSWTGVLTLLGKTKFLVGRQENPMVVLGKDEPIVSETDPHLRIDPCVFDYIRQEQTLCKESTGFYVKRRFEYQFGSLLSVMMIHLGQSTKDSDGNGILPKDSSKTTHLVEVYRIQNPVVRILVGRPISLLGWILQTFWQPFMKKGASSEKKEAD